jgi:hypothetical protein
MDGDWFGFPSILIKMSQYRSKRCRTKALKAEGSPGAGRRWAGVGIGEFPARGNRDGLCVFKYKYLVLYQRAPKLILGINCVG